MIFNPDLEIQIIVGQISQLMENPLLNAFLQNPSSLEQIQEQSKERTIFLMKEMRNIDK